MAKFDSNRHSEDKKKSMIKENELKDKIKQKQEAFAELKKEALKVLTDFWYFSLEKKYKLRFKWPN